MSDQQGKELSSLDFGAMIGGPLNAIVKAQAQAALTSATFIKQVGFTHVGDTDVIDKAINVDFKYLKPNPASWEGGYFGIFTTIEFTKKRKGDMPFEVEFDMEADELTEILGKPVITDSSTTWRKNITDKHELVVLDSIIDKEPTRSMKISFVYEP